MSRLVITVVVFMVTIGWVLSESAAAIVIKCNDTDCWCDDKESCDKMKDGDWCGKGKINCDDKGTSCRCRIELSKPLQGVRPYQVPLKKELPELQPIEPKIGPKLLPNGVQQAE